MTFLGDDDKSPYHVSNAIRLRGIPPNTSSIAFGVVPSLCCNTASPLSFNTQYQLDRSPKSKPMVSFRIFLKRFCRRGANLLHAGLLYLLRFKRVDNLGAYSIPFWRPALLIPSVYVNWSRHPKRPQVKV
jgi:hypothetical protein